MGKLDNRVAIVTGAAQGIGKAVADKLAAEGATVVGADIQDGTTMKVDVSKEADVERMVADTVAQHGKLDVLVNVAAIVPFTPWDEIDFAEWRRIMSVNLDGTFLTNYYAQKPMREAGYGRIVNIASNVILAGTPNLAHYVASKGGVWAFTRALARELGQYGITVNSVAPGTDRDRGRDGEPARGGVRVRADAAGDPAARRRGRHRARRRVPRSEEAGWVTGQMTRRRRRAHPQLMARRAGAILAVADVERSVAFYRDRIGFEVEAMYDDPPYATLTLAGSAPVARRAGTSGRRPAGRRAGRRPPTRRRRTSSLVVEVDDARAEHRRLAEAGVALPGRAVRAAVGRLPLLLRRPRRLPGRDRAARVKAVVLRAPGDVGVDEVPDPDDPRARRRDRRGTRDRDLRRRPLPLPRADARLRGGNGARARVRRRGRRGRAGRARHCGPASAS